MTKQELIEKLEDMIEFWGTRATESRDPTRKRAHEARALAHTVDLELIKKLED